MGGLISRRVVQFGDGRVNGVQFGDGWVNGVHFGERFDVIAHVSVGAVGLTS